MEAATRPDRLELRGLQVTAICGALPEERDRPQPLEIDLDAHVNLNAAGASDDLADTVDYGALCDVLVATASDGAPQLLEHLADRLASAALAADPRIGSVTVAVRKLRPPVPHALATAGVRITRHH